MKTKTLTGNWYIKKTIFRFKIIAEYKIEHKVLGITYEWNKASDGDITKLNINIL